VYLKSLEVQGFKSFPDKTVIRFGDDITAIVGPNGSGKSNISDAILWVMGEQSTKTLRGAKMEDVIFGGTQKRAAVGFAEATLTLDNTDRALPYEADEVMVTRRYYRSGDSEYYINRQSARLRDINEMFMDTGLGKEGYSNIGQGRIDEILSLKSADRREIFEEAAGISKYRHRKEETERKLAHTEDNLLRIGDKVSELELQLEPLKRQSEKAKQYLELKEELQGVEVAVWLDTLEKLSFAAKKAEEDYASASFVLKQAHEDLERLYAQSEQFGADLRHRDGELENIRLQVNLLEQTHQQLDGQMAVLQGNIRNNEGCTFTKRYYAEYRCNCCEMIVGNDRLSLTYNRNKA
jgi:chromosome segregation protein